jgi:hypothetical protein
MLRAFLKPFDGFGPEDYCTFTPDKWSSNLHNLQRMQVRQKLEALGSVLAPKLAALDLSLALETSSERPSIWNQKQVRAQWLYFYRDERAQRELAALLERERSLREKVGDPAHHHGHIVLGVRVDASGVAMLCGVHRGAWLDRRNLTKKWADPHERAKCMSLLRRLGAEYEWVAEGERLRCDELDEARLGALCARADEIEDWLAVEQRYGVDADAPRTAAFADRATAVLTALSPLYKFLAWGKDNDFASVGKRVVAEKKARRHAGHLPFDENDEVEILGGLFAGQRGVVQGFDGSGKVKVKVGTLTLPVQAGSLKRL